MLKINVICWGEKRKISIIFHSKNSFGNLRLRKEISKLNSPDYVVVKFSDEKSINFKCIWT